MYHTSTTFAKYSILAFYHRIFSVLKFRRTLYIVAGVVTCYMISVDLVCLFQCTPVHAFWDTGVSGQCVNIDRFFLASGSLNVILDFIIFALPIPLLWRLRASFNQKLILTAIFTVAGFVVIVSIVRIIVLSRIGKTDLTWNYVNGGIWAETEPSVAVICACLPSLRPLCTVASRAFSHLPATSSKLRGSNGSGSGIWSKGRGKGNHDDEFCRLDDGEDGGRLGHNVA
ncbi:MAG: hypothetical protein Q9170_006415, partial [Blastenia crenularia]